jgi:hypothetical protein
VPNPYGDGYSARRIVDAIIGPRTTVNTSVHTPVYAGPNEALIQ